MESWRNMTAVRKYIVPALGHWKTYFVWWFVYRPLLFCFLEAKWERFRQQNHICINNEQEWLCMGWFTDVSHKEMDKSGSNCFFKILELFNADFAYFNDIFQNAGFFSSVKPVVNPLYVRIHMWWHQTVDWHVGRRWKSPLLRFIFAF